MPVIYPGRIAAVSYLNTIPFIYGLEHSPFLRAGLILSPPSRCVTAFTDGQADIALIPAAKVPHIPDCRIVTPYCLGATGQVRTVVLVSDEPVEAIRRIWLDGHSRTSAALIKLLCAQLWGISPEFCQMDDYSLADEPLQGDAFLLIGDKVFDYEGRFAFTQDLAVCWRQLTGLPFVFAVWIAREGVAEEHIEAMSRALGYGMAHIPESISYYGHSGKKYALSYLTENIDFNLDEPKQRALQLFWEKTGEL